MLELFLLMILFFFRPQVLEHIANLCPHLEPVLFLQKCARKAHRPDTLRGTECQFGLREGVCQGKWLLDMFADCKKKKKTNEQMQINIYI